MTQIAGTLRVAGRPLGGQDVLAFDPAGPSLLAVGATDDRGEFRLDLDGRTEAALLAKVRADVQAVVAATVDVASQHPVELDAAGPFFEISGRLESDVGFPERLDVFLDPVRVDGVPEALLPFATLQDEGVFDAHYVTRGVVEPEFTFRVATGRWRIGGRIIDFERSSRVAPKHRNYVVDRVRAEDGELDGSWTSGFELDVAADRQIVLVLRELANEEL
jgi:hypothetical protein